MTEPSAVETAEIDLDRLTQRNRGQKPRALEIERLDRYEIVGLLGNGGFASVYEGYDPRIKRSVAIKRCLSLNEADHERFFREAEIAGNLSHVNIVRIFDFGVADTTPFIVQELLGGRDLADWIESGLDLSNHDRVHILLQIAEGLAYAHSRGVIHRDIKPANVRVLDDGSVKLLDFGVAAIQNAPSGLTQAGVTVGTAAYLAPEQIRGEQPDRATDIFSFGVLAYELLSGHRPFEGSTLSAVLYQIAHERPEPLRSQLLPERLVRLVHRCLEKNKKLRPAGFNEIVESLREAFRAPGLRPPTADTVPIDSAPGPGPVPTKSPAAGVAAGRPAVRSVTPAASRPTLANRVIDARAPALRDSSTRIQVASKPPRGRSLVAALALLGIVVTSLWFFRESLPEPVPGALASIETWAGDQIARWRPLADESRRAVTAPPGEVSGLDAEQATFEESPASAAAAREPALDPVSAAIETLEARTSPAPRRDTRAPAATSRTRRRAARGPSTVFIQPAWHAGTKVSVDGGPFQALSRRLTRSLPAGSHQFEFRLETPTYQARETVEVRLESSETRTIASPLGPPAELVIAVLPGSTGGRVEIDGSWSALPLRNSLILEPGVHRITLDPSPVEPLGPLTKSVNLEPGTTHVLTFDILRRRAMLKTGGSFDWDES